MEAKKRIIFRVNSNHYIGYGHFFRCFSLAEVLHHNFDILFACSSPDSFVSNQVEKIGELLLLSDVPQFNTNDIRSELEIPFDLNQVITKNDIVVLDGYRFGTNYRASITNHGAKLVCIDDLVSGFYPADLIINSNPSVHKDEYKALNSTQFLLGLDYALLRSPFRKLPIVRTISKDGVLIAMGGSDFYNLSHKTSKELLYTTNENLKIITTNAFSPKNLDELSLLKLMNKQRISIYSNLNANEMVDIMDHSKFAILPTSSLFIEALSRRLPVYYTYYADNQKRIYTYFKKVLPAFDLDDYRNLNLKKVEVLNSFNFDLNLKTDEFWIEKFKTL